MFFRSRDNAELHQNKECQNRPVALTTKLRIALAERELFDADNGVLVQAWQLGLYVENR